MSDKAVELTREAACACKKDGLHLPICNARAQPSASGAAPFESATALYRNSTGGGHRTEGREGSMIRCQRRCGKTGGDSSFPPRAEWPCYAMLPTLQLSTQSSSKAESRSPIRPQPSFRSFEALKISSNDWLGKVPRPRTSTCPGLPSRLSLALERILLLNSNSAPNMLLSSVKASLEHPSDSLRCSTLLKA